MRWSVRPERKIESEVEREKNIYIKCTCYSNRAYMHGYYSNCAFIYNFTCTVTVAIVHLFTILHPLMCVCFCSKCVKLVTFSILHNFAHTDGMLLPQRPERTEPRPPLS